MFIRSEKEEEEEEERRGGNYLSDHMNSSICMIGVNTSGKGEGGRDTFLGWMPYQEQIDSKYVPEQS